MDTTREPLEVQHFGEITVLKFRDFPIQIPVDAVEQQVFGLIDSGPYRLVFDFSNVRFLSTSGLGIVLKASKRAQFAAGALVGPSARRWELFPIYEDSSAAVEAITQYPRRGGCVVLCSVGPQVQELFLMPGPRPITHD